MTALQLVAVDSAPAQPWRNGGGSTRELFTWPAARPWQLRISVADIDHDGPFSAFAGVDRWFAVLQGAGVSLSLPGQPALALTVASAPLRFAGEAAPACKLIAGSTRDLNLMLQRSAGSGEMLAARNGQPWVHAAPLRALLCTAPLRLLIDDQPAQTLPGWTLAVATQAAQQRWLVRDMPADARACWLAFTPSTDLP